MVPQDSVHICWLCGKPVDVAVCKTDEYGEAVHETCYTTRLAFEDGTRKAREQQTISDSKRLEGNSAISGPLGHISRTSLAAKSSRLNRPESIIRCPYCRIGNEFRPMEIRTEGWLCCESCGHDAMPLDPEFRCTCAKCEASRSRTFRIEINDAD